MNIDTEYGRAPDAPVPTLPPSLAHVLDDVSEAIILADGRWRVRYMNDAARRLLGMAARTASAVAVAEIAALVDADQQPIFDAYGQPRLDLSRFDGPLALATVGGGLRPVMLRVRAAAGGNWTLMLRDRSRESGLLARLSHQAHHDPLTGLVNRAAFERSLAREQARLRARLAAGDDAGRPGAVLYLDLDQFKITNDTCGHDVGDEVLRRVATALTTQLRDSDTLARLGGDEFALLLPECSVADARAFGARLRELLGRLDHAVADERLSHTVSIGVVMLDQLSTVDGTLLSAADLACLSAKLQGRDRVEVFGATSGLDCRREMQWVRRLRRACAEQRFVLYRQPIVALDGRATSQPHYELLLRMVDRSGRIVMPAEFIPAAERYNVMPQVDRWTVRHVLSELVWRADRAPQSPYMLSINLSGTSLRDPAFRRDVLALLERNAVAPQSLCFEITETAALGDLGPVADFMHVLKARGCLFSLDDFGTGMASFAYLKSLPVDFMKIDGQFVHGLKRDRASQSMVRAFCDIARTLNIRTIGERVEDAQTARALRALGVDFAQGFYFERPRKLLNRLAFAADGPPPPGGRVAV